jgi:putative membrane protein
VANNKELLALLVLIFATIIWSWINPYDRPTWWLEAIPAIIALPLLFYTRNSFPLTRISYYLIFIHAVILVVGAHYTYARVPLGFLIQDWFDFSRNHYDRIGHLAQGFVPAILAREILWRKQVINIVSSSDGVVLQGKAWLFFLVTCFCLAFSAFYELIEWWSAVIGGDGSMEFLGTQGDVWDAQWDMMLALIGAISAQLLLAGLHHRQMVQVSEFAD